MVYVKDNTHLSAALAADAVDESHNKALAVFLDTARALNEAEPALCSARVDVKIAKKALKDAVLGKRKADEGLKDATAFYDTTFEKHEIAKRMLSKHSKKAKAAEKAAEKAAKTKAYEEKAEDDDDFVFELLSKPKISFD